MLPGPMELVIILVIVAMLFGVGRLPEIFGAVGRGIREFRNEVSPTPSKATGAAPTSSEPVALEGATTETTVTQDNAQTE